MTRDAWIVIGALVATGGINSGGPQICPLPVTSLFSRGAPAAVAAGAAAAAQGRPTFDEVVRDLGATDPRVRIAAMRALGSSGYPDAIGPLSRLLTDPVDEIQLEAIDTLLGFFVVDRPPRKSRVALVVEVRRNTGAAAVYELGPFVLLPRPSPPELAAGLAGAMRDQNPAVRLEATYALGVMATPPIDAAAAETIVAALSDTDEDVRLAAARVAGGLRVARAGDALISAMNDPSRAVQLAAMRSLGDVREARATASLTERFTYYGRGAAAEAALDALARIAHPSSVPLFEAQRASTQPLLRRYACEGLGRTRAIADAAALERSVATERSKPVAMACRFALAHAAGAPVDPLVAALADPDLHPQVMGYLVEIGRPGVPQMVPHLRAADPSVRRRVAQTLGLIGGSEALDALQQATRDPDVDVMRAVERAIARGRAAGR